MRVAPSMKSRSSTRTVAHDPERLDALASLMGAQAKPFHKQATMLTDEMEVAVLEDYYDDSETDSEVSHNEEDLADTKGSSNVEQAYQYLQSQKKEMRSKDGLAQADELRFGLYVDEREYRLLKRELWEEKMLARFWLLDILSSLVVVGNAVLLGLTTEGVLEEGTAQMNIINICFLTFFTIELLIRLTLSRGRFSGARDGWMALDVVCVLFMVVDLVFEAVSDQSSGAALLTVMRLIRLARLIRLVRLVHMFDALWALVGGLVHGFLAIIWSVVVLALISIIFGLLFFELAAYWHPDIPAPVECEGWNSLSGTFRSMLQVATYDGADVLRVYALQCTHPVTLLFFVPYISVAGLGILNLIVGVLLTATMRERKQDDGWQGFTARLLKHRAVRDLRQVLNGFCKEADDSVKSEGSPLLSRMKMLYLLNEQGQENAADRRANPGGIDDIDTVIIEDIDRQERAFEDNLKPHEFKKNGGRSTRQREAEKVSDFFKAADVSVHDINDIYDVAKEVWGNEQPVTVNDFTSGVIWSHTEVHPLDIAEMMSLLSGIYTRMRTQGQNLEVASQQVAEASSAIEPLLSKQRGDHSSHTSVAHGFAALGLLEEVAPQTVVDRLQEGEQHKKEVELMEEAHNNSLRKHAWARFDVLFSLVVTLNALVIGVEFSLDLGTVRDIRSPDFGTIDMAWFIVELVFYGLYVAEAVLRVIFDYQMNVLMDYRTWLGVFPKKMWTLTPNHCIGILRHLPNMLATNWTFIFDLAIVAVATVQNLVLRFMEVREGLTKTLMIFSLARLLRFARLVHLIRSLRIMAEAFMINAKLIFWAIVLLMVLLYMVAIAMVDMIGKNNEDPQILKYWGTIPEAMFSLLLMATFNDWGKRVDELAEHTEWAYPIGIAFVIFSGVGILNLITGVMVQAAFSVVSSESSLKTDLVLTQCKHEILRVADDVRLMRSQRHAVEFGKVQTIIERMFDKNLKRSYPSKPQQSQKVPPIPTVNTGLVSAGPIPNYASETKSVFTFTSAKTGETNASSVPDTNLGDDDEEDDSRALATIRWKTSSQTNFCRVKAFKWISGCEVALQFQSMQDDQHGPIRVPDLSCLRWEGGRQKADFFFPTSQEALKADPSSVNFNGASGVLVFRDIPSGKQLSFRYGGNYPWVSLSPDASDLSSLVEWMSQTEDVTDFLRFHGVTHQIKEVHIPQGFISASEFAEILEDKNLNDMLSKAGIKPEDLLMGFGQLNMLGHRGVRIQHVLDALGHFKDSQIGIDVARAKTMMRGLINDVKDLAGLTQGCEQMFSDICQNLRDVKFERSAAEEAARRSILMNHNGRASELASVGLDPSELFKYQQPPNDSSSHNSTPAYTPRDQNNSGEAQDRGAGVGTLAATMESPSQAPQDLQKREQVPPVPLPAPPPTGSNQSRLSQSSHASSVGVHASSLNSSTPPPTHSPRPGYPTDQPKGPGKPTSTLRVGKLTIAEANERLETKVVRMQEHLAKKMAMMNMKSVEIGLDRQSLSYMAMMTRTKLEDYEDVASVKSADAEFE